MLRSTLAVMKVLLFGESGLQLKGVENTLREAGHRCKVFDQADSVLGAVNHHPCPFDCVLCSDPVCLPGCRPVLRTIRTLHPDTPVFCIFSKTSPEEAARLHEEMMGKGISPDTVSFTILINAFGKANQPHRAWQAFERMEATKNPSNDGQEYDVKGALELMKTGLGTTVPRHGCGTLNHRETIGYRKGGVLT